MSVLTVSSIHRIVLVMFPSYTLYYITSDVSILHIILGMFPSHFNF